MVDCGTSYVNMFLHRCGDGLFASSSGVSVFSFALICTATSLRLQQELPGYHLKIIIWWKSKNISVIFFSFPNIIL